MGGRVVEGTGLENQQARKRLGGSNPSPSAKEFEYPMINWDKKSQFDPDSGVDSAFYECAHSQ